MRGRGLIGAAALLLAAPVIAQTGPEQPAGPAPQQVAPTPPPAAQILTLDKERLFAGAIFGQEITRAVEVEVAALTAENRRIDAGDR